MVQKILLNKGVKIMKKVAGELLLEGALACFVDVVKDKMTEAKIKGKTPESVAKELRQAIEKSRTEQIECIYTSLPVVEKRDSEEMAEKVKFLSCQYVNNWAKRLTWRVENMELSLIALGDAMSNEKKYRAQFAQIVDEMTNYIEVNVKQSLSYVESIYKYEKILEFVENNSHTIVVGEREYSMPDDMIYASEHFQSCKHMIEVLEENGDESSINDMNILKNVVVSTLGICEETERKLRKKETEKDTEIRFAKIVEASRSAANKLRKKTLAQMLQI